MKPKLRIIIGTVLNHEVIVRALSIAIIVGTLLNLINQGDKILTLSFAEINYTKLVLTFLPPYMVSAHTAVSMELNANRKESERV